MRRLSLTLAAATAAMGLATPAAAAITANPDVSGTPDAYQVFGIAGTGNPVYGSAPNNTNTPSVTFDANVVTNMDIKNGAAIVTDADAKTAPSWQWVLINPDLNFTDMKFDITLTGPGSVYVFYLLAGGPTGDANTLANYSYCATCTFGADNNDNHIEFTGGTFNGLGLMASNGVTILSVKQISFDPAPGAVPEPASWAMMLLGFGGMGLALRRSRRRGKQALMQIA